jgi:vanillate O-demethylase monooxygenase subunit
MAFNEDKVVLEAVHRGMAEMTTPNIDLGLDLGAKTFRQTLQRRIDAERSAAVA